jgi:O-antigen ligase
VGTPKAFWFNITAGLFITFFLFTEIKKSNTLRIRLALPDFLLLSFYIYTVGRLLFTSNKQFGSQPFISFSLLVVIYFVMHRLLNSFQDKAVAIEKILFGLILLGGVQSVIGLFQYAGYLNQMTTGYHITGCFGNPGILANYLVCVLPVALVYALESNKPYIKIPAVIVFFLILVLLVLSRARASWIAGVIVLMFILSVKYNLLQKLKRRLNSTFKRALFVLVFTTLSVSSLYGLYQYKLDSANGRLFIWNQSLKIIKERPVFGTGFNTFPVIYPAYQAAYFKENPEAIKHGYLAGDNINAFNEFIEIAVELGIIGLLLFLSFLFVIFKEAVNSIKLRNTPELIISISSIMAIVITAFFSYPFHNNARVFFFFDFSLKKKQQYCPTLNL